ncbi:MAG: hypothetical protein J7M09_07275 [Deltaproteobacteria bacterium]|nr:hypothetical protein [Candidatus Tharpella sp.]
MGTWSKDFGAHHLITLKSSFENLAFNLEVIFGSSFGQVAAIYKQAFVGARIPAEDFNSRFLTSQTARLFFMSAAEFDIARERAYIDEPKIGLSRQAGGGEDQEEEK